MEPNWIQIQYRSSNSKQPLLLILWKQLLIIAEYFDVCFI